MNQDSPTRPALLKHTSRPSLSSRTSSFGPGLPTTRNPLHLKVNRLLSANLEDAGTRAALDTLGEFENVQDDEGRKGGAGIGVALRRGGLRKEVEGRMAEGSREFLEAFSEVNDVCTLPQVRRLEELTSWTTETEHAAVAPRRHACVLRRGPDAAGEGQHGHALSSRAR